MRRLDFQSRRSPQHANPSAQSSLIIANPDPALSRAITGHCPLTTDGLGLIAFLTVAFRPVAKSTGLVELIHRAIPYPVLLIATMGEMATVSVAHKRWSQGETGQIVIDELRATAPFQPENATSETAQFLARLAVGGLPQGNLFALYQSWLDSVLALEAAQITGAFRPPASGNSAVLRDNLNTRAEALRELTLLHTQAEKETQLNRRVEINLAIKKLDARIAELDANL